MNRVVHWQKRAVPRHAVPACDAIGGRVSLDPFDVTCEHCRPIAIVDAAIEKLEELKRKDTK